jgi:SAM-dependent methyltransferase
VELSPAARRATVQRSLRLWRAFRVERTDPEAFYRALAEDTVAMVACFADLDGRAVLDVGAGPGYFAESFDQVGARYVAADPDLGELTAAGAPSPHTVRANGLCLPFATGAVEVCLSSNVLEHVPAPGRMAAEMIRVTKPGGLVVLSFTAWWGPWGGHETAPWHYLGGERAARRYEQRHGYPPKNAYGYSLFPTHVGQALRWAQGRDDIDVLAAFPRYHPWWAWWVLGVPALREVVAWNLVLVLRRRPEGRRR